MIQGSVEIAQHTLLVQDGELMVFIPDGEGGSEPITWDTCLNLLNLLMLVREHAKVTHGT